MPPFTRRDFLKTNVAIGLILVITRFWLDRLEKHQATDLVPLLETPMPYSLSSTVFASGYAREDQTGIHAFQFDQSSGSLRQLGSFAGIANPSFIILHPNGRWLYAVSETAQVSDGMPGGVCALTIEQNPFSARILNRQPSGGDWPCHLRLDTSGNWLFVANYGTGSASVFPVLENGSLGPMSDRVQHNKEALIKGQNPQRQERSHVHSVTLSPDNQFALVADLGIDQIVTYRFDQQLGKLTHHAETHTQPGAGPRHLAFHPNGRWLYVTNELDNTVVLYDYDLKDGTLKERQTVSSLPPIAPGAISDNGTLENTLADIQISASGKRVYASNRGHNSLAVFDVGDDGRLTLLSTPSCGGNWPRNIALAPGDKFLLAANQYSNELCVLSILTGPGELSAPVARTDVAGASCIQVG